MLKTHHSLKTMIPFLIPLIDIDPFYIHLHGNPQSLIIKSEFTLFRRIRYDNTKRYFKKQKKRG